MGQFCSDGDVVPAAVFSEKTPYVGFRLAGHVWKGRIEIINSIIKCLEEQGIRTFSVDRILALDTTPDAFEPDQDFDFDAYTASSFGVVAEPAVTVRIHFTSEWASHVGEREWHASQTTTVLADGGLELTMEVGASQEVANWVLSFGGGAEVLEPESLRAEVRASLSAALAKYRE